MDSQSTSRDRKSFDKTSEGPKNSTCLLRLPCNGNREALDDLFASSSSHLYQAAFRILSNPHDAEDAVQDSLLCAFRNLNQFHGRARFSTWLVRIVINSSLMRLRKRKCRREFPLEPVLTSAGLVSPVTAARIDGLAKRPPRMAAFRARRERNSRAFIVDKGTPNLCAASLVGKPLDVAELGRRAKRAWQLQQCLRKNLSLFNTDALFLWIGITGRWVNKLTRQRVRHDLTSPINARVARAPQPRSMCTGETLDLFVFHPFAASRSLRFLLLTDKVSQLNPEHRFL